MGIKTQQWFCYLVTCDRCGFDFDNDYIPHFESWKHAREFIDGIDGLYIDKWPEQGRVLCADCAEDYHEALENPEDNLALLQEEGYTADHG